MPPRKQKQKRKLNKKDFILNKRVHDNVRTRYNFASDVKKYTDEKY